MDLKVAAGRNISIAGIKANADVEFGRLRMEDLATLQEMIPGKPPFVTIFELARYAETHTGCDQVLLLARRRVNSDETLEDVRALSASILQRVEIARLVMAETLTTGEDGALAGGKAGGPGTGPENGS